MQALVRRPSSLSWAIALAFVTVVGFAGSRNVYWQGDFFLELYPSYFAAMHGDWARFYDLLPGYSGFGIVVGAPAAVLTGAFGGMETMAYRLTAVPGLIAIAGLGVAISGPVRAAGNKYWALFLILGAGGALAFETMRAGHPEDLLATAGAVGAVLAARSGRTNWATIMIVGAVVAKQSMVVALLLVAIAAPRDGVRIAAIGLSACAALVLAQTQLSTPVHGTITNTGQLFHPHQVWWPFGIPATPEFIAAGHGTRMGPEWLAPLTRPILVGSTFVVSIAWWLRMGRNGCRDDVLGVLALVFLLRCMLDPWNLVYYHLPVVVALAAWEARKQRELPVLTLATTAACWASFVVYDARTGNGPFLAYLVWAIPLAIGLALATFRPATRTATVATAPAPVAATA